MSDAIISCNFQAYPAIFDWVTYPVQSMLEAAWSASKNPRKPDGLPSPYLVEIIALLERTLAYAYTGSAKVLSRALMDPLYTSRSLIQQGFPTINKAIVSMETSRTTQENVVVISQQGWPLASDRKSPAMCSTACQKMYYSSTMSHVSTIGCIVLRTIHLLSTFLFMDYIVFRTIQ
jgi:hypothetical protein